MEKEHCSCHEHEHNHEDEHKNCCEGGHNHSHEHEHNHEHEKDCCHESEHSHKEESGLCGCHEHSHEHCGCHNEESSFGHCCCHDHEHGHGHEHEEEMSLKKIIISAVIFAVALILEHIKIDVASGSIAGFINISSLALLDEKLVSLGGVFGLQKLIATALYIVSYLMVGRPVVIGALHNIVKGAVFDEQFLMTIASLGAVFVGEFPEAVAVMLFYQVGEWFQDFAVDKSRDSINSLMEIRPDKATVLRDGVETEIPAGEVEIGDIVVVRPGERFPVDGEVINGKTFIDNSALTGESVPLEIFEGNKVYSGAINKEMAVQIRAEKKSTDSAASRILSLVESSSAKKAKAEKFITRFAKVYTPIVCALALSVAVLPPIFLKIFSPSLYALYGFKVWIYRALIFLVVSCPCAIVISVPMTFFAGIGSSSRKGILVKGSSAVDMLSKVRTVVFDKTGTLTKGVFEVTEICPSLDENGGYKISPDELVALAAHAETYSNHPVSKSLKAAHLNKKGEAADCCTLAKITNAKEISGQGIKVELDGKTVLAGNARLMREEKVRGFVEAGNNSKAGTIVYVSVDGDFSGHIVISDVTKEDSFAAVEALKKCGVKDVVMLTGDTKAAAEKTANELGITKVYSELLPEDKVSKVEELMNSGAVAFAGDGINDAPVLTRSDVGIAMGALGSDAAIESADVVIMNDSPLLIRDAILNARKTIRIVKQNIVFSLAVKALIMILGATGFGNMWIAVFGDTGVALLAVLNALRALK